jgi:glyoxylase-like metal-dependent hydrolase (beta-lactamase superfamily II)
LNDEGKFLPFGAPLIGLTTPSIDCATPFRQACLPDIPGQMLTRGELRQNLSPLSPRADVDCYLDLAREKQLSITHIFETHIHADLVRGARELCARVEIAKIFVSHEGGALRI